MEEKNKQWNPKKSSWSKNMRYIDPAQRKAKDIKKALINIFAYFKRYIPLIGIALGAALLSSFLALVGPSLLSKITNYIEIWLKSEIDFDAIVKLSIWLVIIYIWSWILSMVQWYITASMTAKMSKQMRQDIVNKLDRLPIDFYDKNTIWDILSRITNDVAILNNNINNSLTTIVSSWIMLIGSLVLMIYTNWIMTLTSVLAVWLWISLVFFIMKKSQKYFDAQQKYLWEVNGHIEEVFTWHTTVIAYWWEKQMESEFVKLNNTLKHSSFMADFLAGITRPIIKFTNNLWYVVVWISGALLAFNWQIEFGVIVAFLVYIRYFTQPITQASGLIQRLQVALAAAERIFDFLWEKELEDETHKDIKNYFKKWKVEFSNVNFGYIEWKTIINNLSFTAKPWEKIAIVWPTWAGKTTIINLLMRFYEINSWSIKIDWINIQDMTRDYIHNLFCMVLQDSWIFEWSVKENILYNKSNASDEDIINACKAVWLHHYIMTLPKWYDTVLNEQTNLSMWQKQQLTIARAMVFNAPMLILDEATSSIDTRTELYIQSAMDKLMDGRTSFVIAHRLSTIKNADLILVLKDWDIIEQWNHKELIKKNGFYAELYNSQFVDAW